VENAGWSGFCPICDRETFFSADTPDRNSWFWFRGELFCEHCRSLPRERATMLAIHRCKPNWRELSIHESSPAERSCSVRLQQDCAGYIGTHWFPDIPPGTLHRRYRCEDLERQTFSDASFDLVVTQDVYEHIFDPAAATREIFRTLKPGGASILTTGIWKDKLKTEQWAAMNNDGTIKHLVQPPEYHGNPISDQGSLVTYKFGYDILDLLGMWAPFDCELWRFRDWQHGIVGEFTDVMICWKRHNDISSTQSECIHVL
jgi:SAM-dependent methyltransferase